VISSLGEVGSPRDGGRSLRTQRNKGRSFVTTTTVNDWKELASRERDGLVVSLLWSQAAEQVTVAVADQTLDEELRLDVPSACALDAFYHPFAYAAQASALSLRCASPSLAGLERSAF
jgi:hypothetical protein